MHGLAAESTTLTYFGLQKGILNLESHLLPDPVVSYPVVAATSTADGEWAAIVAWTVHTLVAANRVRTNWTHGGAEMLQAPAVELGLGEGWQQRVLDAVGNYHDILTAISAPNRLSISPSA